MNTMTTRRDLIKLASALGLAGTVPPTADRIAAMQVLDQTASARVALDPGKFADQMYGVLPGNGVEDFDHDWYGSIAPEAYADYAQARERIEQFFTKLWIRSTDLIGDYDAAFFNFVMAVHQAGVRHGSAYEHLRRTVIGDLVQCRTCHGVGATKHEDVCYACGGTGTVALKV
jgi:hypothetical protein